MQNDVTTCNYDWVAFLGLDKISPPNPHSHNMHLDQQSMHCRTVYETLNWSPLSCNGDLSSLSIPSHK